MTVREFLTIAINKQVVEMATNDERKKATSLQQAMETVSSLHSRLPTVLVFPDVAAFPFPVVPVVPFALVVLVVPISSHSHCIGIDSSKRARAHAQRSNLLTTKQQLLALEKLRALTPTAADEVRNIVAEGIANKFGEPYRSFPCTREGVQIRRDAVPKNCSLRESAEEFVANAR